MTGTPQDVSQAGDPVAVILARMEVKLDNALTEQGRHTTTLDRHDKELGRLGNRVTSLETARDSTRSWPAWAATGISALTLGVLLLKDLYS
jgi:hypothetical protein